jgi:copper(I)-binding protein
MHSRPVAIVLTVAMALVLGACGQAGGSGDGTTANGGTLTVTDAWAREAPAGATSAAYLTISNGTAADDTLVGVSAPSITGSASLHQTTSDASGMTGMQHTDEVHIPAGGTVALEPGGFHIMLMDLTGDLTAGDSLDLVLTFEQAGPVPVTATVRAN